MHSQLELCAFMRDRLRGTLRLNVVHCPFFVREFCLVLHLHQILRTVLQGLCLSERNGHHCLHVWLYQPTAASMTYVSILKYRLSR